MKPTQQVFIVRAWLEPTAERYAWRASVTNAATHERHHFTALADLLKFVRSSLPECADREPEREG